MFHELLVAWRGFSVGEATWEPYSVMAVEVPEMVVMFMESHDDKDMVSQKKSVLVFSCGKVEYDKQASATIDARCGYCV
jgi:hypothetical protein